MPAPHLPILCDLWHRSSAAQAAAPDAVQYLLGSQHLKPPGLWDGLLQSKAAEVL